MEKLKIFFQNRLNLEVFLAVTLLVIASIFGLIVELIIYLLYLGGKKAKKYDGILEGLERIKNGEVDYKLTGFDTTEKPSLLKVFIDKSHA